MITGRADRRVFNIPTGAPFLKTFVRCLRDGAIVPAFPNPDNPLDIATARIFVPTHRAARALALEFNEANGGVSLLPMIVPLGAVETLEPEPDEDAAELDTSAARPAAIVSDFERRLALARLVRKWADQLRGAIVDVDRVGGLGPGEDEPVLVATTLAAAWTLAGELGALIDEFAIESIPWDALDDLIPAEFDEYWRITGDFLRIAAKAWPDYLAERALADRARGQVDRVDRVIADLPARARSGPIIVIGSTGANATTARLLVAVARLPNGAVVLPGLDRKLDAAAWRLLRHSSDTSAEPVMTHPQTAIARLLSVIGVDRDDVIDLATPITPLDARAEIVSQAMRPAETTDQWRAFRETGALKRLAQGFDGLAVIEAADEREEALSIAIRLRECLERGSRAALITPDRDIARRVASQMGRWGVAISDSAGEPLRRTAPGAHAMLALAAIASDAPAVDAIAFLSHGLTTFGRDREEVERPARLIELAVARSGLDLFSPPDETIAAARHLAEQRGAHPNARSIGDADWNAMGELLELFHASLAPLRDAGESSSITDWARRHMRVLEMARGRLDDGAIVGDNELLDVFGDLIAHGEDVVLDLEDYRTLFDKVILDVPARAGAGDERLQILGLLEARLLDFDVVILAGLDEGVWPPKTRNDAFLNRSMRARLGMSPPERRIGQTAHDMTRGLGAAEVCLVRSRKRGGAPTVPSRFVQRLAAFVGVDLWRGCLERGAPVLSWARGLDDRPRQRSEPPTPRPPIELRPLSLSVTRIETLRRDPYSIYAERILRLKSLDPLDLELGARDYGTALHETISRFSKRHAGRVFSSAARSELEALAREEFRLFLAMPGFVEFTWPNLERVLDAYLNWEMARSAEIVEARFEIDGHIDIPLRDGANFTLTARADRIESRHDGSRLILDFKTGRPPSKAEIAAGFAPQLPLEVHMLAAGGFGAAREGSIAAAYIKLGGPRDLLPILVGDKDRALDDLAREQFDGLVKLLDQLREPSTAFVSRPYPQFLARFGEYDHLARVGEWSAGGDDGDAS